MKWRTAVSIAGVDRRASAHQLFDFSNIAFGGGRMQALIGLKLGGTRRDLCGGWQSQREQVTSD